MEKYPKVGEKFYWKDIHGNVCEDICLRIDADPENVIQTMYFTYLSENGGGSFVTEEDIIGIDSDEVKKYRERIAIKKANQVKEFLKDEYVKKIFTNKLGEHFKDPNVILYIMTDL